MGEHGGRRPLTMGTEDKAPDPARLAPLAPRRYRRSTTARSHAFGFVATLALLGPTSAAVAWSDWHGIDGGVLVVSAIAAAFFAFPPLAAGGPATAGQILTRAACAVGASAPFVALALGTADVAGPSGGSLALAALGLAVLSAVSRRGGLASTLIVGALLAAGAAAIDRDAVGGASGTAGRESDPATGVGQPADVARVRLSLSGPLRSAIVRAEGLAPLEIDVDLVSGESLEAFAWIAAPPDRAQFGAQLAITAVDPPLAAAAGDESRVRVRFDEPEGLAVLREHPLARRARPALPGKVRAAPSFEAFLCAWAALFLIAAVASRLGSSRPGVGIAVSLTAGAVGALGASVLATGGGDAGRAVGIRVLDGQVHASGTSDWIQVDRVPARLVLGGGLDATPALIQAADGRPWRTGLVAREGVTVATVEAAPGVAVDLLRGLSPGLRLLQPEVNTWADLEMVWSRDRAGAWSAHGVWALGEPLPAVEATREPPAWCLVGLGSSAGAIVGRLARGASGENPGEDPGGGFGGQGAAGSALPGTDLVPTGLAGRPQAIWIRLTGD